jgi:hypothetical protein
MQQFMNANQQHAAIAFFESFLQEHGGQLSPEQTGLYLSSLGVLRVSYANQVPLLSRIAWVDKTIEILGAMRKRIPRLSIFLYLVVRRHPTPRTCRVWPAAEGKHENAEPKPTCGRATI